VLAGTTREEGTGNVCMLWTRLVSVGGVVFLLAFCARQRLLRLLRVLTFRAASSLMHMLAFSGGVNARQCFLGTI
jgi:hypothetical protein